MERSETGRNRGRAGAVSACALLTVTLTMPVSFADTDATCAPESDRVQLTGGTFEMGDARHYREEGPVRPVTVGPFGMDRTEVTNARFAEFVEQTGYVTDAERVPDLSLYPNVAPELVVSGSAVFVSPAQSGTRQWWHLVEGANWRHPEGPGSDIEHRMDHPVVHISFRDALAFADWAGGDLPSEAEWEFAARSGLTRATYEWGETPPRDGPARANTWQGFFPMQNSETDGHKGTAPVGCYEANAFGLYDMTGNVWEWTSSQYDPRDENSGVIKGGSFLCAENFCRRYRPAARQPQERDFSSSHIGFRLVYRDQGDAGAP